MHWDGKYGETIFLYPFSNRITGRRIFNPPSSFPCIRERLSEIIVRIRRVVRQHAGTPGQIGYRR